MMVLARFDRSTLTFVAITGFALTTRLISTAIVTRLATTLTAAPNFHLAVTASVFEIFALFALAAAVGLFLRRVSRCLLLGAWVPGAGSCVVGTLLTSISLGLTLHYVKDNVLEVSIQDDARDLAVAGLIITVLGLIPQSAFYILTWSHSKQPTPCVVEKQEEQPAFTHSEKHRSVPVHLSALSLGRSKLFKTTDEPNSCAHAGCNAPAGACSNLTRNGLHSISSKTRLLSRDSRSIHSHADSAAASEPARANSDFENWDTSAVEAFDNPFAQKTFLEPIPGSRPVSPANPLDGPFGGDMIEPDDIPLPESPPHPSSADCAASFRTFRRPSEHEDLYYHPLFRNESPAPPLTSPGTVITASPFAGEVVSPDLVAPRILHSAASSRPASPGLMSPVRSHAGSVRSFRTVPTSPVALSSLEPLYFAPSHPAGSNTPP